MLISLIKSIKLLRCFPERLSLITILSIVVKGLKNIYYILKIGFMYAKCIISLVMLHILYSNIIEKYIDIIRRHICKSNIIYHANIFIRKLTNLNGDITRICCHYIKYIIKLLFFRRIYL